MEVVFFLLDGCRPDKLKEANTPNIDELKENGTVVLKCKTVYPSLTAVGHMSILTGCYPEKTGIITHCHWDWGQKRFYENFSDEYCQAKTIFEILAEKGLSGGVYGAYFRRGARDSFKKRMLRRTAGFVSEHMNFVMNFLVKHPSLYKKLRTRVVGAFDEFIRDYRERKHSFYYMMFNDTDKAGHKYGSNSKEYLKVIEELDGKVGEFLDLAKKLGRKTAVVVSADHGHIPLRYKIGIEKLDLSDVGYSLENVEYVSAAALIHYKGEKGDSVHAAVVSRHVQFWFEDKNRIDTVADVLSQREEFEDVRTRDRLDEYRLVNERTGDLALAVSNGYGFDFLPIGEKGDHGGLSMSEMYVPLIFGGEGVEAQILKEGRVIDIMPTILKLLGVEHHHVQGESLF